MHANPTTEPTVQPHEPERHHRNWKKILLLSGGGLVAVIVAAGIAGGLSSHRSPAASQPAPTHPASAATPAASQSPSVSQQVSTWFNGGGGDQLKAIGTDSGTIATDMQAYVVANLTDGTTLQADDATFQADIQTAQANLPPAGIPGLRADYNAALTHDNAATIDLDNAVIAANADDYNGAAADVVAANTALNDGNAKLGAATDVNNYTS